MTSSAAGSLPGFENKNQRLVAFELFNALSLGPARVVLIKRYVIGTAPARPGNDVRTKR